MGLLKNIARRAALHYKIINPTDPSYWVQKMILGGSSTTTSGVVIDPDKSLTSSAVWCAVNIIAGAVGYLPMQVYRRSADDSKQPVADHPVYRLLHTRPNPYMDAMTFRKTMQAHVLLWGNAYAEKQINGKGETVALWPLPPDRVQIEVKAGKPKYLLTPDSGTPIEVPFERLLHIKGLGNSGFFGYSVIQYAANNLGLGFAVEEFGARTFEKGVYPCGTLETPNAPSEKQVAQLKEAFSKDNAGLYNTRQPLILTHGLQWKPMGVPPEDAQFLESRKFSIEDVARWFGIPAYMLKSFDNQPRSNIEQQALDFVTWGLMGWLRQWELECTYKLFDQETETDLFAEFNVDALLRADAATRYRVYQIARQIGMNSINELRARENQNPIEGGDDYSPLFNGTPGIAAASSSNNPDGTNLPKVE